MKDSGKFIINDDNILKQDYKSDVKQRQGYLFLWNCKVKFYPQNKYTDLVRLEWMRNFSHKSCR